MSDGAISTFDVPTLASGLTLTSAIDLGRGWNKISLGIPVMGSGADVYVQGSRALDGTFTRLYHSPTTADSTPGAIFVDSTTTNCIVPLADIHVRYLKVELSTAMTATSGVLFEVFCSN